MRHGSYGRLAADLHYALDYIERWLDPGMAERMEEFGVGYPEGRTGFVSGFATYRVWHPNRPSSWRGELLPITSYCPKCNGKNPPINTPEFCRRCKKKEFSELTSEEVTLKQILTCLTKVWEKRELDHSVIDFVTQNLEDIVVEILRDRSNRRLSSRHVSFKL